MTKAQNLIGEGQLHPAQNLMEAGMDSLGTYMNMHIYKYTRLLRAVWLLLHVLLRVST